MSWVRGEEERKKKKLGRRREKRRKIVAMGEGIKKNGGEERKEDEEMVKMDGIKHGRRRKKIDVEKWDEILNGGKREKWQEYKEGLGEEEG